MAAMGLNKRAAGLPPPSDQRHHHYQTTHVHYAYHSNLPVSAPPKLVSYSLSSCEALMCIRLGKSLTSFSSIQRTLSFQENAITARSSPPNPMVVTLYVGYSALATRLVARCSLHVMLEAISSGTEFVSLYDRRNKTSGQHRAFQCRYRVSHNAEHTSVAQYKNNAVYEHSLTMSLLMVVTGQIS